MTSRREYALFFILALMIHTLIAVSVWPAHIKSSAGSHQADTVTVYAYSPNNPVKKPRPIGVSKGNPVPQEIASSLKDTYSGNDALLARLHNTIKSQLHYPEASITLSQVGTVIVHLCLHPSGRIDGEYVSASSGYDRLDRAAIRAVKESPLIENALVQVKCFDLPIIFVL